MQKKSIISLILVLAINLLFLKDALIVKADFVVPDGGVPWPQGMPNTCRHFSDTFIDFENGMDGQLIFSSVPGVRFSTTEGLNWLYGDIRTGKYDVAPYGSQEFVANGNFFGWQGMLGNEGRIDFPQGGATYFSVLASTASLLILNAYDDSDNQIDQDWTSDNTNTGRFTQLTVEALENKKIAYVIISNFGFGGPWLIDDICTDALNVPYFSQCDEKWKNEAYDHTASTICRYGCASTSCAMVLNYYGKPYGLQTNPKELNEWLKNNFGYDRNGNVKWEVIPGYFKDKNGNKIISLNRNGRINFNSKKETYTAFRKNSDSILNNDLINQWPVILKVPYAPWHFIVATGQAKKGDIETWTINDPGWENRKDLLTSYNNNYYGMRRFGPRRKDNSMIVIRAYSPIELFVVDPNGKRLGIDSNGEEYDEIPGGEYYIEDSIIEEGKSTKVIEILKPSDGNYTIKAIGTGAGSYIIDYDSYDKSGEWTDSKTFSEATSFNQETNSWNVDSYELNYSSQILGSSEAKSGSFFDSETSQDNTYTASTLDFSLRDEDNNLLVSPFLFNITGMQKGDSETGFVRIKNDGNLPFKYQIKTKDIVGDLCNDLNLKAELKIDSNWVEKYNGSITEGQTLLSEPLPVVDYNDVDDWQFTISLPPDVSGDAKGKSCNFKFVFNGWQDDGSGGFSDTEKISSTITSALQWNTENANSGKVVVIDTTLKRDCAEEFNNKEIKDVEKMTTPIDENGIEKKKNNFHFENYPNVFGDENDENDSSDEDEDESQTGKTSIIKEANLKDNKIIPGNGKDDDNDDNDDNDNNNGKGLSSGPKFVDSVQPPGGYHITEDVLQNKI